MLTKRHIVEKDKKKKHLLFFSPISTVDTTWVTYGIICIFIIETQPAITISKLTIETLQ